MISYTVLIEYDTLSPTLFSNSPNQLGCIRFIVDFFKSLSCFFIPQDEGEYEWTCLSKNAFREDSLSFLFTQSVFFGIELRFAKAYGPAANRTRVSSVQARYSTTRLQAHFTGTKCLSRTRHKMMRLMINSNLLNII